MVVQRKWMYLESIFIGGDIRAQLPEEAKKFDDIDKTFKKVCSMLRFCVAREGVSAKELVIGGRGGGVVAESKGSCPDVWIYQFH